MMSNMNAADLTELDEGDEVTVEYVSKNSADRSVQTVTAEILRMDTNTASGHLFGDVYLAVHRDEDDHLPRRRIHITAGSFSVEYRRTTRNGPEWNRLSVANSVTVSVEREDSEDDSEDGEDADSEDSGVVECSRCNGSGERGPDIRNPDPCDACEGTGEVHARDARDADGHPISEGDTVTVGNGSMTERVETVHPDGRVTLADGWTHPAAHLHVEGADGGEDDDEPERRTERPSDGTQRCDDCGARVAAYAPSDHREGCSRAPGGEACEREFGGDSGGERRLMTDGGVDVTEDSDEPEVWAEAREWGERNGFLVTEGFPREGTLSIKTDAYRYVLIDEYGGVELLELTHLANPEGDVSFGDKQMTVTEETGESHHVSASKFPGGN